MSTDYISPHITTHLSNLARPIQRTDLLDLQVVRSSRPILVSTGVVGGPKSLLLSPSSSTGTAHVVVGGSSAGHSGGSANAGAGPGGSPAISTSCVSTSGSRSVRLTLASPKVGPNRMLQCHYDLKGETLYAMKMFKNGDEVSPAIMPLPWMRTRKGWY